MLRLQYRFEFFHRRVYTLISRNRDHSVEKGWCHGSFIPHAYDHGYRPPVRAFCALRRVFPSAHTRAVARHALVTRERFLKGGARSQRPGPRQSADSPWCRSHRQRRTDPMPKPPPAECSTCLIGQPETVAHSSFWILRESRYGTREPGFLVASPRLLRGWKLAKKEAGSERCLANQPASRQVPAFPSALKGAE